MKLTEHFSVYQEAFIRLIFPAGCGICQNLLEIDERGICRACRNHLVSFRFAPEETALEKKFDHVDEGWCLYPYESPAKELLTQIKFFRKRWLVHTFEDAIQSWAMTSATDIRYDFIVPIPIDRQRLLSRQFNQSELIARTISKITDIPLKKSTLIKRWGTQAQSHLTREERLTNLKQAFKIHRAGLLKGKSILLVDDILTTGATADEAAAILKVHGAKKVDVFAIAYTEKEAGKK